MKVYRTTEGTIFECAAAFLTVIVWALIIHYINVLPDTIPTHFNAMGEADSWGSKDSLWIVGLIATAVTAACMVIAYSPQHINLPVKRTTTRHFAMSIRMMRIVGILIALLFLNLVMMTSANITGNGKLHGIAMWVIIGLIIATTVFYSIRIRADK